MIAVQHLPRRGDIYRGRGGGLPGQIGQPLQVGPQAGVFGRGGRQAGQVVQLAHGDRQRLVGQPGGFQPLGQFLPLARHRVILAQLLLDRFELLAQEELALGAADLLLHLGVDLLARRPARH